MGRVGLTIRDVVHGMHPIFRSTGCFLGGCEYEQGGALLVGSLIHWHGMALSSSPNTLLVESSARCSHWVVPSSSLRAGRYSPGRVPFSWFCFLRRMHSWWFHQLPMPPPTKLHYDFLLGWSSPRGGGFISALLIGTSGQCTSTWMLLLYGALVWEPFSSYTLLVWTAMQCSPRRVSSSSSSSWTRWCPPRRVLSSWGRSLWCHPSLVLFSCHSGAFLVGCSPRRSNKTAEGHLALTSSYLGALISSERDQCMLVMRGHFYYLGVPCM